jgi:hypothetical protein
MLGMPILCNIHFFSVIINNREFLVYFLCTLNIAGPHALTILFCCAFTIYLF